MPALAHLGPVVKTAFLIALERVGNTFSKQELLQVRALLESGMPLLQIFQTLHNGQQHGVEEAEIAHVGRDWFDPRNGWWTEDGPEKVMREGLINSIDLSIKYGEPGDNGQPFPVDYWWVQETGAFRFISKVSAQQQTVFLLTPKAPSADGAPARAKARKAAKKAPRKTAKAPRKTAKKAPKKTAKKAAKKRRSR